MLKVCLCVKLELSVLQDLLCKSAWLDRSRIRLDWSKHAHTIFLQNFPIQPKPIWRVGLSVLLLVYKGNPKHVLIRLFREKKVCLFLYLGFCTQKLSKVFIAPYTVCESFYEIKRWLPSHILRVSKIQDYVKNLVINLVVDSRV